MGLEINFSLIESSSCASITLRDVTGDYSAGNLTGYGGPNPDQSDITEAEYVITDPAGLEYTVTASLPSVDIDTVITPEDLGLSSSTFADGIWLITYTVTTEAGIPYNLNSTILLTCAIQCCLDKLIATIDIDDKCDCNSDTLKTADALDWFLQAARYAAQCDKPNKAQKLLERAQFLCNQKNCNC